MQKYVKIYLKYFDIGMDDVWYCEACLRQFPINNGLDIHHIYGRLGDKLNDINNLCCVCRRCHELAHSEKLSKSEMQYIHNNFMLGHRKKFVK